MEYREFKPDPLLSQYVECYWTAQSDKPPFRPRESLIPDGTIELMFNFGDDYTRLIDGRKEPVKGSHIIGIRKQTLHISQTDRQDFFSVRFKLNGIYPVIQTPVHLLANGFYSLEEILGREYRELEEQMYEASSSEKRIRIIETYLRDKIYNFNGDNYHFVHRASGNLLQNSGRHIKTLVEEFNTNYKTLERKFKKVMGLTPSELLKLKRFNNAVYTLYSCKYRTLTEVAYRCGYYDQSHFIREFRHLTGLSPREFLKEQFTIVQVIQPALANRLSKSYNL